MHLLNQERSQTLAHTMASLATRTHLGEDTSAK